MHRAFKLDHFEWPADWHQSGIDLFEAMDAEVVQCLDIFISKGEINGSLLRDEWFPEFKADVFISHSHKDEAIALNLAGFLHDELGLSSFIDSRVWGYSATLLKILDDKYCRRKDSSNYDYDKRNGTTGHVNMMLATALSRMIDSCECVIFASSPNSVSSSVKLDSNVSSPWIFYELAQMEVIQKRPIAREGEIIKESRHEFSAKKEQENLVIKYDVDFGSLTQINASTLVKWRESWGDGNSKDHALDHLYKVAPHRSNK